MWTAEEWRPINGETPRGQNILLWGEQDEQSKDCGVRMNGKIVFVGYWDEIDSAWCSVGSHWTGPFFNVTHWMPLGGGPEGGGR